MSPTIILKGERVVATIPEELSGKVYVGENLFVRFEPHKNKPGHWLSRPFENMAPPLSTHIGPFTQGKPTRIGHGFSAKWAPETEKSQD